MNILDKLRVGLINTLGRDYGLEIRATSSYEGSRDTRFRNSPAFKRSFGWGEDRALGIRDRTAMVLNSQDMQRNRGIVAGIIDQFADRTAGGSGIQPLPSPQAWPDGGTEVLDFWRDWRMIMDAQQRRKGPTMDKLNVKTRLPEGEVYFVKQANGQVMPVEGQRVTTPDNYRSEENKAIINGVRVSKRGIPLGIYVCPRKDGANVDKSKYIYVTWENVIPVGCSLIDRYDQLRPSPQMSPVLNRLHDQGDLVTATLDKARMDAYHGWAYYTEDDTQTSNQEDRTDTQDTTAGGMRTEKLDKAMIFHLGPDGKLESLASNTPNSQYKPFNEGLLREVAVRFGIPYEVMMLDMMGASFSGGHGIWQAANLTWNEWGLWLVQDWLQPLWNWRVAMAIRDKVIAPANRTSRGLSMWSKVEWQMPRRFQWDEGGTARTNKTNLEMGVTSVTSILRAQGQSREQIFRETQEEIDDAMMRAETLAKNHPTQPVDWRDFMSSGTPGSRAGLPSANTSESERDKENGDDK